MNLTKNLEAIHWSETHYIYVEKIGPFQDTAMKAWEELHRLIPAIKSAGNTVAGYLSLYKFHPQMTYCAGVSVLDAPKKLPQGLKYMLFEGGNYLRFVLTGSYSQLPEASGVVFETVAKKNIELREGFCIEHYVNNPKDTPENELVTEILLPVYE